MRFTRTAMVAAVVLLGSACAQPDRGPDDTSDGQSDVAAEFARRAEEVSAAWQDSTAAQAWRTDLVLLQPPTVLPRGELPEEVALALRSGWLRTDVDLPGDQPGPAEVTFTDGETMQVPVIPAEQAWREVSTGEPDCPQDPLPPPPEPTGTAGPDDPDRPDSSPVVCTVLDVTGVDIGAVTRETNRGPAQLPAWLFEIDEADEPLARVAVPPELISQPPRLDGIDFPYQEGLAVAAGLGAVDGNQLTYQVGIGACDQEPLPLVYEDDEVIVVGGHTELEPGVTVCTDQLVLAEVTVSLDAERGHRPVLATTGEVLSFERW